MSRNSSTQEIDDSIDPLHRSIRDRFRFKRNTVQNPNLRFSRGLDSYRPWRSRTQRSSRKSGRAPIYYLIGTIVFMFVFASAIMQRSITSMLLRPSESNSSELEFGRILRFVAPRRFVRSDGLDLVRSEPRVAIRPPRLSLILGNMNKDPQSLLLFTVVKNLQGLGYKITIYAVKDGEARSTWEQMGIQISILNPERFAYIDWSIFEGIVVESLEAREAISSLMQDPFCSIPLIWIIQESILANRLLLYEENGWEHLVSYWRNAFNRADVVVFPDFSLPMLYSGFDTGNFFVIPGSPTDVWSAETFIKTHSKNKLRVENGLDKDDIVVLVVGSSFFYNEISWDSVVAMLNIGPLLSKYARRSDAERSFRFFFFCGNSTDEYNVALQDVAKRLRFHPGFVRHYDMNADVNNLLLMSDIVLYSSSQDEQGFPSLLIRAMSFGIPVVAPDSPVIKKYIVDGVHGIIYPKHNADALMRAFSLLISNGKLSRFGHIVASSGRLLAKNMLALECITGYVKLLENVLDFPSDAFLPLSISQIQHGTWDWNSYKRKLEEESSDMLIARKPHFVYALEEGLTKLSVSGNTFWNETNILVEDVPTKLDWDVLEEIQNTENHVSREMEEINGRIERYTHSWDEIYRNSRKVEKLKFETNERDEGELERTGQQLCIYEMYKGVGTWKFLHHGSLYRGLSLSTRARRIQSDDVDAVQRLSLLNDTYYQDILCEVGGMFSIANVVDNIHKRPWIGFQSWRVAGRKLSLSIKAEKVLSETVQKHTIGDVLYFWVRLDMDVGLAKSNNVLTFWSMCDILNGGHCRTAFENSFRRMYSLPLYVDALPPMPENGGYWAALNSWVMPTPSFLEFIMFARMFVDSLNAVHNNSSRNTACLLGSSKLEKKQCYCRILEVLVNVWAYHTAREMVYMNPRSGSLEEQHPVEERKGFMWARHFNFTLLKSMDEDLAEAALDGDYPTEFWLWPLTGEVHWQGVYEKEREDKYRFKMNKKRKTKENLLDRMKHGYKQKSLGMK